MSTSVRVRRLKSVSERELEGLADVLVDCVEGGASVSFMLPLSRDKAQRFWREAATSVAKGERVLLVAQETSGELVGTVQVIFAPPENQPHRADVAKMLVRRSARRQGIGDALLAAAEESALESGKTLLVLDTASADAERLYQRRGWQSCGVIPNYALLPDGQPCATTLFYKLLDK